MNFSWNETFHFKTGLFCSPCFLLFPLDLGWVFPSPEPLINITNRSKTHTKDCACTGWGRSHPHRSLLQLSKCPMLWNLKSLVVNNEALIFLAISTMGTVLGQHYCFLCLVMILCCRHSPRPSWGSGDEESEAKDKVTYPLECTLALPMKRLARGSLVSWSDEDLVCTRLCRLRY